MEYAAYLQTRHWQFVKKRIYKKYKACQRCGKRYELDVHHLSYRHLFNEQDDELMLLCRHCHYAWHNKKLGWKHIRPSDILHFVWIWLVRNYSTPYRRI